MTKLHSVHPKKGRGHFDLCLLVILIILLSCGLIILYSATRYTDAKEHPGQPFYTITRQVIFLAAAFVSMLFMSKTDYHKLLKLALLGFLLSIALGILVLFFGKEVNGQKRWFAVGPISFQPAEFAKLMLIFMLSSFFHKSYRKSASWSLIIKAVGITLPIFLPVVSANLSSGLIIAGIAFVMTYVASEHRPFFLISTAAAIFTCVFAFQSGLLTAILDEYQMNRIYAWIDPEEFPLSNGFQVLQGLYAIGAGGLFGTGLGNSLQKLGFLPEAQNDMIFSIICEELGLFGAVLIIFLFLLLLWRMMEIAQNAPDDEGMFLVSGIMGHIGIQVLLNIAVVTNTIPNTGISLPFISYGGSSILFLLTEMGIVFRVSSESKEAQ